MKKWCTVAALAAVLTIGTGTIVEATTPSAPAPTQTSASGDDDGSNAGLFGLIGLLGLAGLAGLKRRRDTPAYDTATGASSPRPR